MAQIFHVDGRVTELPPPKGGTYTLDEIKRALGFDAGRFVERLPIGDNEALLIDEDGKLRGEPLNMGATLFAHAHGALAAEDYIVGDAAHVVERGGGWT